MFEIDGRFVFSPTDITNAVVCEFGLLRRLDVRLGRIAAVDSKEDPMLARTARLGDAHEERVLAEYVDQYGAYDDQRHSGVYLVERQRGHDHALLAESAAETLSVLRSGADVVYQASFLRDRFNGFADFLVRDDTGAYAVYDSKLARHAKVSALLQLAAYGDELRANGVTVAPQVYLILGDRQVVDYDLVDLIPVYRERRARLEAIVDEHLADEQAVAWNDRRFMACGRCDDCAAEVEANRDLLLVAGMRVSQRSRLREADVLTIDELAARVDAPEGIRERTYASLHAQAAMQVKQDGPTAPVVAEVFNPAALAVLPPTDPGDIFFDFEGDPLWTDGDPTENGLEYLFGVVEIDTGKPGFRPFWAHDRAQEKQALQEFVDYVAARRAAHPGLHIYHYAAYEKTALLRLAGRYGVGETVIDELLTDGVLVDLYSVVRNSLRVSQPSYSLKKLEPLYMGSDLRAGEVTNAGDSIVAYAVYCGLVDNGEVDAAAQQLGEIADYNEYDCISTLRLRDWLRDRATEHGVELVGPRVEDTAPPAIDDDAILVDRLMTHVGDGLPGDRSAEQQAIALLTAAVGYHRRELKPFWWAHFDRLLNPVTEWADTSDVFLIDSAAVIADWSRTGRQQRDRRTLRLTGRLGVGSRIEPGQKLCALYDVQGTPAGFESDFGRRGVSKPVTVLSRRVDGAGMDELEVEELCPAQVDPYRELPMALAPGDPIRSQNLHEAIATMAAEVADAVDNGSSLEESLAGRPGLDLLARRAPRLMPGGDLPSVVGADYIFALTAAVRQLDRSYLAVQGPPGSGKTYVGSQVIAELVKAGWRIGVVAQSHKVVENVLRAVIEAGVDPDDVAKKPGGASAPTVPWTSLDKDPSFVSFLTRHAGSGSGCVLGGTAWDFTNRNRVAAGSLDLLVIDEAGQFSLANTIAVSTAASRLLLLGDPQQLPQVSQGTHPEPCDESALSWVIEGHRVMPADRGYFLAITWRMHPDLTEKVSQLAYDGALRSKVDVTAQRHLAGVAPGLHIREVDHVGNSVESPEEAAAVVATIADVLGSGWTVPGEKPRPLTVEDVLVVAPYNAQVSMIRKALDDAGYHGIDAGSVDKFQGQEAPVVIVSMTASAPEDVPRGMDFLLSRNRVNVAISRAQWATILIRSPRLTDYLPTQPTGLSRLGAFIGLCED